MKRKNLLILTFLLVTQTTPAWSMLPEIEIDKSDKAVIKILFGKKERKEYEAAISGGKRGDINRLANYFFDLSEKSKNEPCYHQYVKYFFDRGTHVINCFQKDQFSHSNSHDVVSGGSPHISYVFDDFIGREITLGHCIGQNKYMYLDSYDIGVHLSPQTSGSYTGTHWTVEKNHDNSYSFKGLGFLGNGNKYLDFRDGNVRMSPHTGLEYPGTHWTVEKNADQTYSFKCLGPQGNEKKYLDSRDNQVCLSPHTGTHWKIGLLDLKPSEVYNVISNVYKTREIKYYDHFYQSLTTDEITNIWNESNIKNYIYKTHQFQCVQYADFLKVECTKWIYHQPQLFKKKTPALGIMGGSKINSEGKELRHAYNFYITPYLELKLIEPQNGKELGLHEWLPYRITID